jgi:hypothetical protein
MKGGASPTDIQNIAKYFRAGHTPEQIASAMNLHLHCVVGHHPDKIAEFKERRRIAERAGELDHKKKKDIMQKAKVEVRAKPSKE